jgi:molybdate transport system substrate-binding protein
MSTWKIFFGIVLWMLLVSFSSSSAVATPNEETGTPLLSIYAASSLTLPLTEAARYYTTHTGIAVTLIFDASAELVRRIEETGDGDLLITDGDDWLSPLRKKQLLDTSPPVRLFGNSLAVIAAKDSPFNTLVGDMTLAEMLHYIRNRSTLVIGDPTSTPLGIYSQEMLQKLGLWNEIANFTVRAGTARSALYFIAEGKTIGIAYITDAIRNPEVRILRDIDPALHRPIRYYASRVVSDDPKLAEDFVAFLQTREGQSFFTAYGFTVPKD